MNEMLRKHLALECKGIDERGDLVRIAGPDPDTIHRVYVARCSEGDAIFFRADVSDRTRQALLQLPLEWFFTRPEQVRAVLAVDAPVEEMHVGRSYIFTQPPAPEWFRDVTRLAGEPEVFAVLADGQAISMCQSSRENMEAGEAWVQTQEEYRRRGYARQVTAAWGADLLARGKTPFYSHVWENLASRAVALSLGLHEYLQDAGYA